MAESFFIDTGGNSDLLNVTGEDEIWSDNEKDGDDEVVFNLDLPPFPSRQVKEKKIQTPGEKYTIENVLFPKDNLAKKKSSDLDIVLAKSVITPGFEQLHAVPMQKQGKHALRKQRKEIRDRTKGGNWFHLPATTVTEEIKNDLDILKMRSVLDPKHVYKKNDITATPKYFQIGKVVASAADFYSGRIPKSQRKRTIVDELLADSEFKAYQKKKFKEIVDDNRRKKGKKAYANAKKLKRKKNNK